MTGEPDVETLRVRVCGGGALQCAFLLREKSTGIHTMRRTLAEQYLLPERRRWKIRVRLGMHFFLVLSSGYAIGLLAYYPVEESKILIPMGVFFVVGMLFLTPILMDSESIPRYLGTALQFAHCSAVYIFLLFAISAIGSTGAFKKTSNKLLEYPFASAVEPGNDRTGVIADSTQLSVRTQRGRNVSGDARTGLF